MTFPPPQLRALASEVAALLQERKATLSLAETACGGLIASTLLSTPGASAFFVGSVNCYSLPARKAWLGWTEEDDKNYAGPTEAIVLKLANAARDSLNTTWAISESGVSGPSRPDKYRAEIKGPGYCPIAIVGPDGFSRAKTVLTGLDGPDDRAANMVAFAAEALTMLKDCLLQNGVGAAKA